MSIEPDIPPVSGTSVSEAKFNKVVTLEKVFKLLVEMIQILQQVAISQSQRLQFLTEWQKAYTDLMNQVPVFTQSSELFGGTDSLKANRRDDINRVNSTYTDQMRSARDLIGDDAKALQATLNSTNDEVSQQSNTATSLLQEMSTLLSTIFR